MTMMHDVNSEKNRSYGYESMKVFSEYVTRWRTHLHTQKNTETLQRFGVQFQTLNLSRTLETIRNNKKRDDEYVRVSEKFASGKTDVKLRG